MPDNNRINDNNANSTGGYGFHKTLQVVGNFIGTHGLAVFLVIFYTLIIYPQSQNERKEWIEEITKVKQMIDPKSRPINYIQADAVLRIVTSSFIERLNYNSRDITSINGIGSIRNIASLLSRNKYAIEKYTSPTYEVDSLKKDMESEFYLDKTRLSFHKKPESKERGLQELDKIYIQIQSVFTSYLENRTIELKQVFEKSLRNNTAALIQLERLNTENGPLDDVWRSATDHLLDKWLLNFEGTVDSNTFDTIREVDDFVSTHPQYNEWSALDPNRKMFPKYDVRNMQDIIFTFQNEIEQELINQLKNQTTSR